MDISVVVATYNRSHLLDKAIQALLNQKTSGLEYEIIVVDNNSTDQTEETINSYVKHDSRVRYIFEKRQGVAYGRNAGISAAQADLIAFCDDDVCVTEDWVQKIFEAFVRYPDAEFVGGRVLPVWTQSPPSWVTGKMPPLAFQDHGDAPVIVSRDEPRCLISACLAVRKRAIEKAGAFPLETQRVKESIGSTEDADWEAKVWHYGGHGMYVPEIVCFSEVPLSRLAKSYHRRWHLGHGRFNALARRRDYEGGAWRFLDVPAFVYRQLLEAPMRMVGCLLAGQSASAFEHEMTMLFFIGFVKERWTTRFSPGAHRG